MRSKLKELEMFVDAVIRSHDILRNTYVGMINFNTGEREAKAGPREHICYKQKSGGNM